MYTTDPSIEPEYVSKNDGVSTETNLPAQLFFSKQGFRAVRVLRGYYEDSGEDAFLMQYRFAVKLFTAARGMGRRGARQATRT